MKVASTINPLPLDQDEKVIQGIEAEEYEGPYTIHPSTDEDVILETAQRYLSQNVTVEQIDLQTATITPSKEEQIVVPDSEHDGLSQVSVEAIPEEYIIPTGTIEIGDKGIYDVSGYRTAQVDVSARQQDKTVTPTEEVQIITADQGEYIVGIDNATVSASGKTYASFRINLSRLTAGQTYRIKSGACSAISSIGTDYFIIDTLWTAHPGPIPYVITSNNGVSKNLQGISMTAISNWENANIVVYFTQETINNSANIANLRFETVGYDGLGEVTVEAIDPNYIGSAIPKQGETIIIPTTQSQMAVQAGYYTTGDVTVTEIPYSETSNPSGGYTVNIGG